MRLKTPRRFLSYAGHGRNINALTFSVKERNAMQINVITQSVGVEETLGSCTAEQPIDADITLPDYCPDIRRVLKCLVTPRITAVQTAGDRATADGSAGVCVIYTDEQGNVCCFEQTYPFSKYADLKGADENCCVNVRAYTQYANCRAVSPRRLDIHAVVSVAFGISGVKEESRRLVARYSLEPLSRITSITRTVIPEIMERESPEQFLEILKLSFRRIRQRCP